MPEWMPSAKAEINPSLNRVLRTDSGAAKLPSILCLHLHLKAKIKMKNKNESRGNQFILPVQPKLSRQSLLVPCPSPWPDSPGLRRDTWGRWADGIHVTWPWEVGAGGEGHQEALRFDEGLIGEAPLRQFKREQMRWGTVLKKCGKGRGEREKHAMWFLLLLISSTAFIFLKESISVLSKQPRTSAQVLTGCLIWATHVCQGA